MLGLPDIEDLMVALINLAQFHLDDMSIIVAYARPRLSEILFHQHCSPYLRTVFRRYESDISFYELAELDWGICQMFQMSHTHKEDVWKDLPMNFDMLATISQGLRGSPRKQETQHQYFLRLKRLPWARMSMVVSYLMNCDEPVIKTFFGGCKLIGTSLSEVGPLFCTSGRAWCVTCGLLLTHDDDGSPLLQSTLPNSQVDGFGPSPYVRVEGTRDCVFEVSPY